MTRHLSKVCALFAFAIVWSTAASAVALTDEEKEALRAAVKDGSEAYSDGRFLDAVEAFERAEAISRDTRVQYNLARALEEAGHCERAKKRFESLVENDETQKLVLEKAREKVEDGLSCTPRGQVTFVCETPGAQITLAGEEISCGDTVQREAAELDWTASAAGHLAAGGTISVVEAETVNVVVSLRPRPEEGASWKTFAGIGLLGAGLGGVAIGVVSDSTATRRSERIVSAVESGDRDRLARLQDDAQTSKVQTLVLYSAGAALAVGGIVLLVLDLGEATGSDADTDAGAGAGASTGTLSLSPIVTHEGGGFMARWRW